MFINIPREPGVYLLLLKVSRDIVIKTRSKVFNISRGYYVYIGSARCRGGLYSRLNRYMSSIGKKFWHIDYLVSNTCVKVVGIMYRELSVDKSDWETYLAVRLKERFSCIKNFGCSDKIWNTSHLYKCGETVSDCLEKLSFLRRESFKYVSLDQLVYKPL